MNILLAQLFGIGLAAALAGPALPGVLAYLMSVNRRPLLAGTAFLFGAASVALLFCILGLVLLGAVISKALLHQATNVIFVLLGIVFLYVGLKAWLSRNHAQGDTAPSRLQRATQGSAAQLLLVGAVAQVVNSDALIVLLPGVDVIDTAGLAWPQEAAALVFLVIVLLMFAWTVVVVAALGGKPAMVLLSRFGAWLRAHERTASAVTGVVIGVLFLLSGLAGLRGGA
jgi:threonine/homoserine/homoserine lactone efflux protein